MSEKELVLAVIQQAIVDAILDPEQIKDPEVRIRKRAIKDQAIAWLNSKSTRKCRKFSFVWYCHLADLDPVWARERINSLYFQKKGKKRRPYVYQGRCCIDSRETQGDAHELS